MKRLFIILFATFALATTSSAQEIFYEIKNSAEANIANPSANPLVKKFSRFKVEALNYMAMKMREEMPDSTVELLDKEALSLNTFLTIYTNALVENSQQPAAFQVKVISAFMDAIKGNPSEAIFFMALNTGMRLSEILGLRWSRVDFKNGRIKVDAQLLVKRVKESSRELGLPKNSKPRSFKPAPAVMECLHSLERQQKEWRLKAGPAWDNAFGLVFTNEIRQEIPHATVEHRFSRVLESAGIEAHRFHDLRHTFTVESLRAGVDVKTLSSDILGHSSVSFTLDVYGHVTKAMQDEAANKLQAVILGRK